MYFLPTNSREFRRCIENSNRNKSRYRNSLRKKVLETLFRKNLEKIVSLMISSMEKNKSLF